MDFTLTKEQQDIINAAKEFARKEFPDRAQEFDREETFDFEIWKKACNLGFVGLNIKEEYGGQGLGIFEHCLVTEEFWAVDAGIGTAIISTAFGSELLSLYGTEEHKRKYLPPLISGKSIMGTAITEPDAGSDVTQAVTTAVRDKDEYVINGSKIFLLSSVKQTPITLISIIGIVLLSLKRTERDSRPTSCAENLVYAPAILLKYPFQMSGCPFPISLAKRVKGSKN